ncbi:MAG: sodium:panthothenate symporter [Kiritimatiellae bacterium]|nr:sodium:panthothenate symporter [Kiritimatiellia bacterium]
MHPLDWLIMLVPLAAVLGFAIHARKYARDAVDFLAAGRVASRYVICVGDLAAGLSVINIVASCEATYKVGSAMGFWNTITMPLGMFLALTGYCTYRWRASRALSFGQFVEMRYNRSFRVFCAVLRNIAEMVTNAIGPAIAANFFIYFLGLPHKIHVLGVNLPCFAILVGVSLVLATLAIWPAGRISLLITDTVQSLLSYPIFVIVAGYIFLNFNWHTTMEPVMLNRVPGESFLNPFDISKLRDFNMFALGVTVMATIIQRASWYGNDTTNSARTPHEQKMAGILGTWRNGFAFTMVGLTTLLVITVMNHKAFVLPGAHGKFSSHETRKALLNKVAAEAVPDAAVRGRIADALDALPPRLLDEPLSQLKNNDTIYIDTARDMINGNIPDALRAEAAAVAAGERAPSPELAAIQGANALQAQKVRTLYGQMMLPATLRQILPTGVIGLFALLMIMLLVSTDDSRIFNASSTWAQDVILPFMKKPPTSRQHIALLRWSSVAVAVFFFVVAVFFSQLDYINMFTQIMCAIWLGGGGTVMVFGLYSRFGNIVGAWCSIFFGCGFSLAGLILQRVWSASVVPVLARHGWTEGVFRFFAKVAEPLNPYVDWSFGFNSGESTLEQAIQLFREKFFMNSTEIYGISMVLSLIAYCLGSWIALKAGWCKPFNLDKLLHRGEYADEAEKERMAKAASVKVSLLERIVGIDGEYTRGDRIIAWSVFIYSIGYGFGVVFLGVLFWNFVSPWPKPWWGTYYFITSLIVPIIVGCVSTVWFMWGGIRDGIRLFKDLDARVADASDNGFVDRKS